MPSRSTPVVALSLLLVACTEEEDYDYDALEARVAALEEAPQNPDDQPDGGDGAESLTASNLENLVTEEDLDGYVSTGELEALEDRVTELEAAGVSLEDQLTTLELTAQRIHFVDNETVASETFDMDEQGDEFDFRLPADVGDQAEAVYLEVSYSVPAAHQGDDFTTKLTAPGYLDAPRVCSGTTSGQEKYNDTTRCHVWLAVEPGDDRDISFIVNGLDQDKADGDITVTVTLLGYLAAGSP